MDENKKIFDNNSIIAFRVFCFLFLVPITIGLDLGVIYYWHKLEFIPILIIVSFNFLLIYYILEGYTVVYCRIENNKFIFSDLWKKEYLLFQDIEELSEINKKKDNNKTSIIIEFKFKRKTKFGHKVKVAIKPTIPKSDYNLKTVEYLKGLITSHRSSKSSKE